MLFIRNYTWSDYFLFKHVFGAIIAGCLPDWKTDCLNSPEDQTARAWAKREEFPLFASYIVEEFTNIYKNNRPYEYVNDLTTLSGVKAQLAQWIANTKLRPNLGRTAGFKEKEENYKVKLKEKRLKRKEAGKNNYFVLNHFFFTIFLVQTIEKKNAEVLTSQETEVILQM